MRKGCVDEKGLSGDEIMPAALVSSAYIFSCHKRLPYNHFLIYETKTDFTCCGVTDVQHLMGHAQVDISDTYPF